MAMFFFFNNENQVQVQPVPGTSPVALPPGTSPGALPTVSQPQVAVLPQAQPASVLIPPQQQVPNNQVLYAAPSAMPVQGVIPQVVAQNPTQYQSGMVTATPGGPITGQVDPNTATPYGAPAIQPVVSDIIVRPVLVPPS